MSNDRNALLRKSDVFIYIHYLRGEWFCMPETGDIYSAVTGKKLAKTLIRGYHRINSRFRGIPFSVPVSRAVWISRYGLIPPDLEIDHINGNKTDNRIENLRMVTHKENANNPATKSFLFTREQAEEIREHYRAGATQISLAEKYGCGKSTISNLVRGKTYGYTAFVKQTAKTQQETAEND